MQGLLEHPLKEERLNRTSYFVYGVLVNLIFFIPDKIASDLLSDGNTLAPFIVYGLHFSIQSFFTAKRAKDIGTKFSLWFSYSRLLNIVYFWLLTLILGTHFEILWLTLISLLFSLFFIIFGIYLIFAPGKDVAKFNKELRELHKEKKALTKKRKLEALKKEIKALKEENIN